MANPNDSFQNRRLVEQSDPMTSEEIQAGGDAGLTANLEAQRTREDTPARSRESAQTEVEASKPQQSLRSQNHPTEQNQSTALSGATAQVSTENPRMANQVSDRANDDVPGVEGGKGTTADITAGEEARMREDLRTQIPTDERTGDEPNSNAAYQDPKRAQGDKA